MPWLKGSEMMMCCGNNDKRCKKINAKLEAYEIAIDTLMLQQDSGHSKEENEAYEWLRKKLIKERDKWFAGLKL